MKDILFLWACFVIVIACAFITLAGLIQRLSHPQERSFLATLTTTLLLTSVVASLLLPVLDVSLVSATNLPSLGVRRQWATDAKVDAIVAWIKVAYFGIYGLTAAIAIILVPFSWIYYEEWEDEESSASRIGSATKYTIAIVATFVILFAIGLVVPAASSLSKDLKDVDFEYLKELLAKSRPMRSLLFLLGVMVCLGTVAMIMYTTVGLSAMPIALLKTKNAKDLDAEESENAVDLDFNRQKQRQLELRYTHGRTQMSQKDRRELESLQRRERALLRAARLKAEGRSRILEKLFKPLHIFCGLVLLVLSLVCIMILAISLMRDLLSQGTCGARCRFLGALPDSLLLNPIDLVFTRLPYFATFVLHTLLMLFLLSATLYGVRLLGIRFLWMRLFRLKHRGTVPQGLLSYAVLSVFAALGLQYTVTSFMVPGYIQFGGQTFCNATLQACAENRALVKACSLATDEENTVCARSVISRVEIALAAIFPQFGLVLFWAQFAVVGIYVLSLVISVFRRDLSRVPGEISEDDDDDDDDAGLVNERTRLV